MSFYIYRHPDLADLLHMRRPEERSEAPEQAPTIVDRLKVDAVARCLAQCDERFVAAADWAGEVGERYRARARRVLATIERFEDGVQSGGLP